ncbi:uncharacterized protein ANIA_11668 [Aspergillus nidulans FGSC A4]|uniref:Uncharacterized protein n=1 Tax=Emericella nidulans (strain FGSC A4 / ATCC 38163 / CBS 112.46 / NRRL 194 / M139) TaxID=227321 RepID=C8V2Z6_EMENI|nr:hypothetical protein [Aspergillus nidulans FGSC A4]CBF71727.1 TPA: hypothetical protein ANIA_11668 [Aspergillus nidulans FGSC A4]
MQLQLRLQQRLQNPSPAGRTSAGPLIRDSYGTYSVATMDVRLDRPEIAPRYSVLYGDN